MQKKFNTTVTIILISFLITAVYGCVHTPPKGGKYHQTGLASWYGKKFHGRRTANGEVYNMYKISAAHKTAPLGSHARVVNLENGREIRVRINDRGPFIKGRIIDLSYGAAKKIRMVGQGTAKVRVEFLEGFDPAEGGQEGYYIQVGSFLEMENASSLKNELSERYSRSFVRKVNLKGKTYHRVCIGPLKDDDMILDTRENLNQQGFSTIVVSDKCSPTQ